MVEHIFVFASIEERERERKKKEVVSCTNLSENAKEKMQIYSGINCTTTLAKHKFSQVIRNMWLAD